MTAQQLPGAPHEQTPVHDARLSVTGLSRDATNLLLENHAGARFALPIDDRLRALLRDQSTTTGQLEVTMESTLRPRDIQARIRAGESPETVARAASTTVEKIMPYAAPVLAERAHITERARRSSLRRPGVGARTLGEAVASHLGSIGVDPDALDWDAWRRLDGRWTVVADASAAGRTDIATFAFDAPGNFVVLEDEQAHWLVGAESLVDTPVDPVPQPAPAPLTALRHESADLTEHHRPSQDYVEERPVGDGHQARPVRRDGPTDPSPEPAATAEPETLPITVGDQADRAAGAVTRADSTNDHEPPVRRPVRKKGARASVPSWDEIMFGGGDKD